MAISARNESANACKLCLDAANDDRNGIGTLPATLLTKTIFPDFRCIIDGSNAANTNILNIEFVFFFFEEETEEKKQKLKELNFHGNLMF